MGTKAKAENGEDEKKAIRKPVFTDNEVFTFAPRVSSRSEKIVQSLGSDFMSRQQQHLEKQKKTLEACNLQYRSIDSFGTSKPNKEKTSTETSTTEKNEDTADVTSNTMATSNTTSPSRHEEPEEPNSSEGEYETENLSLSRTKTMPPQTTSRPQISRKLTMVPAKIDPGLDRIRYAKTTAEKAMKHHKVFTIQGTYKAIRESLRSRGWVEKFYKLHMPHPKKSSRVKKKKASTSTAPDNPAETVDDDQDDDSDDDDNPDDDYDDDTDGCKVPPWEEDNGTYGIMSRMVRNSQPNFIWCVRRDAVDTRNMREDQIINHYGKATFTTKVGLCLNMRNVPWFEQVDPNTFFPRCYRLSHDEEKQAFIDDYRLTMCMNIMKIAVEQCEQRSNSPAEEQNPDKRGETSDGPGSKTDSTSETASSQIQALTSQSKGSPSKSKKKKGGTVPVKILDIAIHQVRGYLKFRNHEDLDAQENSYTLSEDDWDELLKCYYQLVHDEAVLLDANTKLEETKTMVSRIRLKWPQFDMDGCRNVWIVKPGAKSRGRGIICYDRLEEMLRLVSSTVVKKESKFVVQKYIERPLLVYNTKFDIRQWFLVTDWNPLTIYFYKSCYIRFCSQEYTLQDFNEAIHLSNNAIQGKKVNGVRSSELPDDNMWTIDDFKSYLADRGAPNVWDEVVYPGMKQAINAALLCTQDIVEYRKSAFELYGADFMMTEDYQPWLIEINSSPSMSSSTKITAKLCNEVLQDTIKVVLDRKYDRNCDIGQYELSYKQSTVTVPPYIGMNLSVEGQNIKKPNWIRKSVDEGQAKTVPGIRLFEATSSQTSIGEPSKVAPKSSASAEFKSFSKLVPIQNGVTQSKSSHARLNGHTSGLKPTLSASNTNNNSVHKLRSSSAGHIQDPVKVCQSSAIYKLARDQTKAAASRRRQYLSAVRKSDQKYEDVDKENESVEVNPIENNLLQSLPQPRNCVTPIPIPIEFSNREETLQTNAYQARTVLRGSSKDPPSQHKEIKTPVIPVENETNAQSSDNTPDLREMHVQLVKGNSLVFPYPITSVNASKWGKTCASCGAGMNLHLDHKFKARNCKCQTDSLFSMDDVPLMKKHLSQKLNAKTAQWRLSDDFAVPRIENEEKSQMDEELVSYNDSELCPVETTEVAETVLPKKINIDSQKLISSVCAKTQSAQTVCLTGIQSTIGRRRTFVKYRDTQLKKTEIPASRLLECSHNWKMSRSCSASCSANKANRAIQGFPNMLSRFKMNSYIPQESTSYYADNSNSIPKLTVYQPKFIK